MENKRQIIWLIYACILCLCFSRTTALLTGMMGLPLQVYLLMTAALIAAVLLIVYLPVKLLAGRFGVKAGKLTMRGKMTQMEWVAAVLLIGMLICARLFFAPAGIGTEGQFYYESARNFSAGLTGFFSADLYIVLLRAGIGLFGETYAVFWCNLILQAAGCFLIYNGIRRLSGTIYAVTAIFSVIVLAPFSNSAYSAGPQNLLLFAAGVMLFICSSSMEWILKHSGNRWAISAACGAGICSGAIIFVDIRLMGFILLFMPGFFFLRKKKKAGLQFPLEYSCAAFFGFFALLLCAALFFGNGTTLSQSVSLLLKEWHGVLNGENDTALLHSPTLTEYWRMIPVYLLAFCGLLGGMTDRASERILIWILPLAFLVLTDIAADAPMQEQGIQFLIWSILSGYGIIGMLRTTPEEGINVDTKKREDRQKGKTNEVKNAAAASIIPAVPAPGEYLENPLPVPKRHIKKEMDYAFEPEPGQMYYEVPVADHDDFDV